MNYKNTIKYVFFLLAIFIANKAFSQELTEKEYAPFNLPFLDYISSYDFADFNSDNRNDIVVVTTSGKQLLLAIKYNEGDSLQNSLGKIDTVFDYLLEVEEIENPAFIAVSDIDGDGDSDLYVGEVAGSKIDAGIGVLENKSSGDKLRFVYKKIEVFTDEFVMAIPSVVDIDGDGLEELIISNLKGQLTAYKNNGSFRFSKMDAIPLIGYDFSSAVSFSELSVNGNEGIISYNYEKDFQFFGKSDTQEGLFKLDTTVQILRNPDTLRTKLFQPRFKDVDNDENKDLFLSTLTFSNDRGYYTDSWLFPSTSFGAIASIRPAGCANTDDGQINLDMRNGLPPYSYSWVSTDNQEEGNGNFISDSEKLTDLPSGNYSFTVTDANGRSIEKKILLNEASPILIQQDINGPACPSDPTGSVLLTPIDGRVLNYLWEDGSTKNGLSDVVAGKYNVTISDEINCQVVRTIRLEAPDALRNDFRVNNCGDGETTIIAAVDNGQLPYTYEWNTGDSSKLLTNRTAGTYILTITDATGCQKIDSVTVDYIEPLTVALEVNNVSCAGANDGSINLMVTGGADDMNFIWNNEIEQKNISNLSAGNQSLKVSFSGCSRNYLREIKEPSPLFADINQIKKQDGSWEVWVSAEGGINPHTINWSNGETSFILTNQEFGTVLSFSIEDKNGCVYQKEFEVGTVGVSNQLINLLELNLFPNPTDDVLNISVVFPEKVASTIEIFDVSSRLVYNKSFDSLNISTRFDVSELKAGTYFVKIAANGKLASRKFIVH